MGASPAKSDVESIVSALASYPFFDSFPREHLANLAHFVEYMQVPRGRSLLKQGQINSNLYILISGKLSVVVDGEPVATLSQAGSLVGEMSVISRQPTVASIVADSTADLYFIKVDQVVQVSGPDQERLQYILYRIYSQVLSQKLALTNQKAKRFEEMNRRLESAQAQLQEANQELEQKVEARTRDLRQKTEDLGAMNLKLEQKGAEVLASHRKLEELYASRSSTMSHLQKLYKDHLIPLRFALDDLVQAGDPGTRRATEDARTEVMQAIHLLEPIATLYSTELAMRTKKVMLADSNKKQQIQAKMALGGTGVHLDIVSTFEEGQQKLKDYPDILFVDAPMLALASRAVAERPGTKVVLMTTDAVPTYLPELMKLNFMPNIVSRSEEDRTFTIKNIVTTVTKLISNDIFGIEKYLSWGVEIREHAVTTSRERQDLIHKMDQYFEGLGVRRTNRERAAVVSEELLMNAIYDAPVDQNGASLYNHLPRSVEIELRPEHQGRYRYATDGMFTAISVEDPFGALSGSTILKYLQSCYGGQAGSLNAAKGGAGRGLHQIVENSDLVVFNLQPGLRTEVIALFNVDPKQTSIQYPTFHLFIR